MREDFCAALKRNDRAKLKTILDPILAKLDAQNNIEKNFEAIKHWLEQHDCVAAVEIGRGVLRSDPPIKEFYISVRTSSQPERKTIGVRLGPKLYEFDHK